MGFLGIGDSAMTPAEATASVQKQADAAKTAFVDPNAAANRSQLENFYNTLQGRTAVQGTASAAGTAQASGSVLGTANQVAGVSAGNASLTNAANAGNATQANAANAGQAALNRAATINGMASDQDRASQQALNSQISSIATGQQSGLGAVQYNQAQAQNIAAANAMAQSGRTGQNAQLIARNLQSNLSNQNSQAAAASAVTAMQEQQAARAQLSTNLGTVAGQDIGLAQNQAALQQQSGLANQQALNQQAAVNSGYAQQASLQNASAANTMAATNAGYQQQASLANQASLNAQSQYDASNQQQANLSNQSALNAFLTQQAQLNQQNAQYNTSATNSQNDYNATNAQNMTLANLQAQQTEEQLQTQGGLAALGQIDTNDQLQVANQQAGVQASQAQQGLINTYNQTQNAQQIGMAEAAASAIGKVASSAAASDKRKKKKIKSADQKMEELLDKMTMVSDQTMKQNITTNFNSNPFNQIKLLPVPAVIHPQQEGNSDPAAAAAAVKAFMSKMLSTYPTAVTGDQAKSAAANAFGNAGQFHLDESAERALGDDDVGTDSLGAGAGDLDNSENDPVGDDLSDDQGADGGGEGGGGGEASDERTKSNKVTVDSKLGEMLDKLQAYQYEYKDPSMEGASPGKHLGVMAQDLEKSDAGKLFVDENDDGVKMVQYGKMLPTLLASMATMHHRVKALEAR